MEGSPRGRNRVAMLAVKSTTALAAASAASVGARIGATRVLKFRSAKRWPTFLNPPTRSPLRTRSPIRSARGSRRRSAGCAAAVRQRQGEAATIRTGADELHGLLLELQRHEFVQEPVPVSPRPVYGRLLVFARKAFYHLFFKWHARAVLQQQNGFNQSASRLLTELAARQKRAAEEGARLELRLRRLEQALLPAGDADDAAGRDRRDRASRRNPGAPPGERPDRHLRGADSFRPGWCRGPLREPARRAPAARAPGRDRQPAVQLVVAAQHHPERSRLAVGRSDDGRRANRSTW